MLLSILEAATWAPSSSNRQDWEFVVVTSSSVLADLATSVRERWEQILAKVSDSGIIKEMRAYVGNFDWFSKAPALVVVTCKRPDGFLERMVGTAAVDVGGGKLSAAMAAQNLMLAASASGLGSCCLTGPLVAADAFRAQLGIAGRREIVCLVALGYPAEVPPAPKRRELSEVVRMVEGDDHGTS